MSPEFLFVIGGIVGVILILFKAKNE